MCKVGLHMDVIGWCWTKPMMLSSSSVVQRGRLGLCWSCYPLPSKFLCSHLYTVVLWTFSCRAMSFFVTPALWSSIIARLVDGDNSRLCYLGSRWSILMVDLSIELATFQSWPRPLNWGFVWHLEFIFMVISFFFDQGRVKYTQYHRDLFFITYINTKIDAIYILVNFVS